MINAKVIKRTISIEYTCPTYNKKISECIKNPAIHTGSFDRQYVYDYITVICKMCGTLHTYELEYREIK